MSRLTIPGKVWGLVKDSTANCGHICEKHNMCTKCPIQEAMQLLVAYEDTGLTPPQITELQAENTRLRAEQDGRGMKVKSLNWTDLRSISSANVEIEPHTKITYTIQKGRAGRQKSETYICNVLGRDIADEISCINFSLESAKAACQAHFERFIASCIEEAQ